MGLHLDSWHLGNIRSVAMTTDTAFLKISDGIQVYSHSPDTLSVCLQFALLDHAAYVIVVHVQQSSHRRHLRAGPHIRITADLAGPATVPDAGWMSALTRRQ
jgi:hypothetical protein